MTYKVRSRTALAIGTLSLLTSVASPAQETRFFRILSSSPTRITHLTAQGHVTWTNATPGLACTVQTATVLAPANWADYVQVYASNYSTTHRLFDLNPPAGMTLVPAGHFQMGDSFAEGGTSELPIHSVHVSGFYMDQREVTSQLWDEVYHWATNNGYTFRHHAQGKAANHPAHSLDWYDAVLWCNARSEKEGRVPAYYTDAALTSVYRSNTFSGDSELVKWNAGYRLPTEAEWEKATRGGAIGRRFSWADRDTISHDQANYFSPKQQAYDLASVQGFHPTFYTGALPYTSPAGYFAPNGFGLYDMSGNIAEWCWDWYASYSAAAQADPHGPNDWQTGLFRVVRGGAWDYYPVASRASMRLGNKVPTSTATVIGFRTVLPAAP